MESVGEFVVALRELALDCQIPADYLSHELALQIVSGCYSVKAHERMLIIDVNLEQYLAILESDEAVREDLAAFSVASSTEQALSQLSVHPIQRQHQQSGVGEKRTNDKTIVQDQMCGNQRTALVAVRMVTT